MIKTNVRSRRFVLLLLGILSAAVSWKCFETSSAARAAGMMLNDIARAETVFNTDFASAGFGGMRTVGTGSISLSGVSGQVTKALLYWHGPTNSSEASANASVTFNGTNITGANIGFSQANCWPFTNSQAYRADVTAQVKGNGTYSLGSFRKNNAEVNGASLIVFFDDGNPYNNRDVVMFHGNDSNRPNEFDADGWTATLPGINYSGGNARIQLHVSDGQAAPEDGLKVNGKILTEAGPNFSGDTVPIGTGCCGPATTGSTGGLWDIKNYNLVPFLTTGQNTVTLTTGYQNDCLSLIVALIDLPVGAAPPPPDSTADLAVSLNASPNPVFGNSNLTHTITVRNNGSTAVNSPVLSTNLSSQTTFLSLTKPEGWNCSVPAVGSSGSISCSVSSVGANATATFTLTTLVVCAVADGATISQTVSVQSGNDSNSENNSATATVTAKSVLSQARVVIANGKPAFDFGPVAALREVNSSAPSDTFIIENPGCAPISLRLQRIGVDVTSGKIIDPDDSAIFSLFLVNGNGSETLVPTNPGALVLQLPGGQIQTFRLRFHPLIPILSGKTSGLFANQAIPDVINSQLIISQAGSPPIVLNATGRVATPVQLIHPNDSRLSPLIVFTRTGVEYTVECSAHDPNLDLYLARYQFFDQSDRPIGSPADVDLVQPIAQRGLVRGQSFTIIQKFAGLQQLNVAKVQVTLFDRETNVVSARTALGTAEPGLANVSAASYLATGLTSESVTAAFGADLSSNVQVASTVPLPTSLGDTSVRVRDGAGTERLAPLFFVSPNQINYQMPPGTRVGAGTVTVVRGNQVVARETVQVSAAAPSLFSANANGLGVAAGVVLRTSSSGITQQFEPISRYDQSRGQFVSVPLSFGSPSEQVFLVVFGAGLRFRNAGSQLSVKVAGVDAQVLYAGAQGEFVGLDQVNILLPRSLAGRGEVDVVVTLNGKQSNAVKVNMGGSAGATLNLTERTSVQPGETDAERLPILRLPVINLPATVRNSNPPFNNKRNK